MNTSAIVINIFTLVCLVVALLKDRVKTKESLIISVRLFMRILPAVITIAIFISLLQSFVSHAQISKIIGEHSGLGGILFAATMGAILHIPTIISFPLAASFLKGGASVTAVAAFVTTLTMVGVVTLPLEIKELGKKIALLRNAASFIIAVIIALIMGKIL
ncbi:MAG: permease [Candidatus Omnitrophica bacterium]|nr:permease [Candidatus Omnitrophota bacterium]MBL7210166.1 permease [Candidatus Omnitrophota bacterium]